ncbi:MAG: hypothetical protein RI955_795 [Bacteroidota bacterium]|jgi:hypothetical protein
MLGIIFLYYIWKYYSELALDNGKTKWVFGLLGIAAYYGGTFLGGVIIGIVALILKSDFAETTPDILLGLLAMPLGILTVIGLYKYLKYYFSKKANLNDNDILDAGSIDEIV